MAESVGSPHLMASARRVIAVLGATGSGEHGKWRRKWAAHPAPGATGGPARRVRVLVVCDCVRRAPAALVAAECGCSADTGRPVRPVQG